MLLAGVGKEVEGGMRREVSGERGLVGDEKGNGRGNWWEVRRELNGEGGR